MSLEFDPASHRKIISVVTQYLQKNGSNVQRSDATPDRPFVPDDFWGKINGFSSSSINGNPYRAIYLATEQQRTPTGFQDLPGGRGVTCLNSVEAFNASSVSSTIPHTIMGNSIDHTSANYPTTNWFLTVQGNPVVRIHGEYDSTKNYVYTFEYVNQEFGAC
jgi:hypothetical protein